MLEYYLAKPASATGPGVLVLHAWCGLNPFTKDFCNRLAREGLTVLAPDLYHGAVAVTIEEAQKLRSKLKREAAELEIGQAVDQLRLACGAGSHNLGVVGFSLGGYYALGLAEQPGSPLSAAVIFYSARGGDYTQGQAAYQFHLAETDAYVSTSGVKKLQKSLKAAGRQAEFHIYPGTAHWFFESDRPDAYHPQAAASAWSRTVEFLKKHST